MVLASVLGRIVCSIRAVVPHVRGATSAAGGLCSAAGLQRAPVLSSTLSLRCSSYLIPSRESRNIHTVLGPHRLAVEVAWSRVGWTTAQASTQLDILLHQVRPLMIYFPVPMVLGMPIKKHKKEHCHWTLGRVLWVLWGFHLMVEQIWYAHSVLLWKGGTISYKLLFSWNVCWFSPRLPSPLPALCQCSVHGRRWNSTKAGMLMHASKSKYCNATIFCVLCFVNFTNAYAI